MINSTWKKRALALGLAGILSLSACQPQVAEEGHDDHTHESYEASGPVPSVTEVDKDASEILQGLYDTNLEKVTASDGVTWYKGRASFYDTFDTVITIIAYVKEEAQFDQYMEMAKTEFMRLHKLYDNYHIYDGINNVMTLNEEASKGPVVVDKDLLDIVKFSEDNYEKVLEKTNIGMGTVLELWHDARDAAGEFMTGLPNGESEWTDPATGTTYTAKLPDMAALKAASAHTNLRDIVVDEANSTIRYENDDVKMDLGAVAKGYATEVVAQKLEAAGLESALISAGGNVRSIGIPQDGRDAWGVGIQNPRRDTNDPNSSITSDVLYIGAGMSVVTSGDYQRFYTVDGVRYHHLIDPETLMPATHYASVSVVTPNSGLADYLSTAFFLSDAEDTQKLLANFAAEDIGVIWIDDAGHVTSTDNMKAIQESER